MDHKRYLRAAVLILLTVMLFGSVSAFSDSVDLKHMSDEEVVALLDRVNSEIVRRGIEKTAKLSKGSYIGGVDIPAGRYVYTCLARGSDWGNVTVYSNKGAGKQLLWEIVSAPDQGEEPETIFITLNEGDRLESGVPFSLTVMTGITFR